VWTVDTQKPAEDHRKDEGSQWSCDWMADQRDEDVLPDQDSDLAEKQHRSVSAIMKQASASAAKHVELRAIERHERQFPGGRTKISQLNISRQQD
jgi:hypothetical protein